MNIYAEHGSKVRYANPTYGYTYDQETCQRYLTLDAVYVVDHTVVHSCSTEVYLVAFPGVRFNSVMFEDAE